MDSESLIVTSTMFSLQKPGEYSEKYHYSRYGNPTRDSLEAALAELDDAKFVVTYTSKAAASLAALSTLKAGDRVIFNVHETCEKFKELCPRIEMEFRDLQQVEDVRKAFETEVQMLWLEVPASLLMTVLDMKAVAEIVHSRPNALFVVDNTLFTPQFLKPLNLGADAVICSLGEFVAGHSDVSMGSVVTNSEQLHSTLRCHQYSFGMVPSPFDCFIVQRSLKTLSLRMEKHSRNSVAIAMFLESHPKVKRVIHTSLAMHANRDIIFRHSGGHCAVVSFRIKGSLEQSQSFLQSLKLIRIEDTLGGTDTTVALGTKCNLIRVSVGLECEIKLIADLNQALAKVLD